MHVGDSLSQRTSKFNGPASRKERRKTQRVEKRSQRANSSFQSAKRQPGVLKGARTASKTTLIPVSSTVVDAVPKPPKSILKKPPSNTPLPTDNEEQNYASRRVAKRLREQLEQDDADIDALERVLGVKGRKRLPKVFDDGLDDLLAGLEDSLPEDTISSRGQRGREEEIEWLSNKRAKAAGALKPIIVQEVSDEEFLELSSSNQGDEDTDQDQERYNRRHQNGIIDGTASADESFESFGEDTTEQIPRIAKENPYIAPVSGKYIAPSLRQTITPHNEDTQRLQRQVRGLLNRLTESNILSIVDELERLYRENPRQYVSTNLIDLLMDLICDRTSLEDTFLILHGAFIAAIYKVVGTEIGAQLVLRIVQEFDNLYLNSSPEGGKRLLNLTSLISQLYNFHVVSSGLMFDLILMVISDLSEKHTELLLKIVRSK